MNKYTKMQRKHDNTMLEMYMDLPNPNFIDKVLYEKIANILNKYGSTNGIVLDTMKAITIMLCEECVNFCDEEDYKEIQEINR